MILDATCKLDYQLMAEVPAIFMLRPRSGWAQWIMREEFQISPQVPVVEFTQVTDTTPRAGCGKVNV